MESVHVGTATSASVPVIQTGSASHLNKGNPVNPIKLNGSWWCVDNTPTRIQTPSGRGIEMYRGYALVVAKFKASVARV